MRITLLKLLALPSNNWKGNDMKLKAYVHSSYDQYEKTFRFCAFSCKDMPGYVFLEEVELDYEEPSHDAMINGTVAAYRAEQKRLRAEAEEKATQLERQIGEMLAIEDKREAA